MKIIAKINKNKVALITSVVTSIVIAFLLYPHSYITELLWLVGSFIAPGIENSITGWFVFINLFIICTGSGILVGFISNKVRKVFRKYIK